MLLLTAACGKVNSARVDAQIDDAQGADTQGDDARAIDGPPPPCDLAARFRAPSLVGGVNTVNNEWGMRLSPDQLVAYISSDINGTSQVDMYIATRATVQNAFGKPVALDVLNTASQESAPSVTADGLTIYFHSNRTGSLGANDLFTSTRTSTTATFPTATRVANVNTAGDEQYPYVMPDGRTLYFQSDGDLYYAIRGPGG
jgi:hypothetical protein